MPDIIYNLNIALVPYAFILGCIVVLYLLFIEKQLLTKILCLTFLIVIAIQMLVGFGGDSILKAIFGNRVISVVEGNVNPPNADPILVQRFLSIQQLFWFMGMWFTPICLIAISIYLIVRQLLIRNKLSILMVILLTLFALTFFIESAGMIFGIFGTIRLRE